MIPILTKEESKHLIRWHNSHKHLESVGSNIDYAGVRKLHIKNEYIRQLFQKVENHCISEIYKATGKVFYPEMAALNRWHKGGHQDPHLDTYSNQEVNLNPSVEKEVEEGNEKPSREWTVIVYLNDDYSGGETYFPPSDYYPFGTQIEQEVGSGVLFKGINHGHGVFKVRRGYRHTVSVWFTEDIEKAMTQRPVSDLGYNENTIRGNLNFNLDDGLFQSDVTQDKQKWIDYKRKSLQNFK